MAKYAQLKNYPGGEYFFLVNNYGDGRMIRPGEVIRTGVLTRKRAAEVARGMGYIPWYLGAADVITYY